MTKDRTAYPRSLLRDYLQWDTGTWARALSHWDGVLGQRRLKGCEALDLGARDGGLTLYLAQKGMRVVCSDLEGPSPLAHELHARHGIGGQVTYAQVDATAIPFADGSFDVVVFKSLLGGIGACGGLAAMRTAVGEMLRVLRPGGVLLFAENQRASLLHRTARRLFVPWGRSWHYASVRELEDMLAPFACFELRTHGFLACFCKDFPPFLFLDRLACGLLRPQWRYVAFGHAVREGEL
ncbi:MAG: class I SAM-dependent methyltransferase [Coriobacteriales bacterium]|nr:class I SAM-dependent methyltransferase [Coriobacteriales bacterium]